jgi:hypothetical protein
VEVGILMIRGMMGVGVRGDLGGEGRVGKG